MRAYGFSASFTALALQVGLWSVALSQESPFLGEGSEETERLPQFQIEIIAFAYNAFDPTEEQFQRKPRPTALDVVPEESVEVPGTMPPQGIDPNQRPGWPPTAPEPVQSTEPVFPGNPGLEPAQTDIGVTSPNEVGPAGEFGRGVFQGPAVEEQLSVSERILSALLTLEEEPDPLDPTAPNDPLSPRDPGDPFGQGAAQNPGPGDFIAVEDNFGSVNPLMPQTAPEEPEEDPFEYRFLSREELELTNEAARLNNLGAYTVLAHGGWIQEGLPEERAHPFNIGLLGALNPLGTVQLHLSRFLHVTVALDYHARPPRSATPVPPQVTFFSGVLEEFRLPPVYELRATRRTRSGELHYFDHPAFGLLVMVRPAPEVPEETEESLDPPLEPAA